MSEEIAIIEKKKAAWGELGVAVHKSEMQLQATAQQITEKVLKVPTKPEEVKEAEERYKTARAEAVKLVDDRKLITSKFDSLTTRLMQPEKSLTEPLSKLSLAIISVKKAEELRVASVTVIEDERKRVRQAIQDAIAKMQADFDLLVVNTVAKAYDNALGAGDVKPENLLEYLAKCKVGLMAKHFVVVKPVIQNTLPEGEYEKILANYAMPYPVAYANKYLEQINTRFSDYNVAYANKQQALEIAAKEKAAATAAIEDKSAMDQTANKLEAMAETPVVSQDFKALKKVFKIKMEENPANAVIILHQMVANWDKVKDRLRLKKWFQLCPANAIVALESLKNEDNAFAPSGITFVEESKL